jgi:putative hydrolase of the HAD superfamily
VDPASPNETRRRLKPAPPPAASRPAAAAAAAATVPARGNLLRGIRAVTFDIGGTLIRCRPSVGHIYAAVAAEEGYPRLSPARLNRGFAAAWRAQTDFHHTRAQWAELVEASFRGSLPHPPGRRLFARIYDRFRQPEAWHVFRDVRPALEALSRRGLRLGVISNWDHRLRPLLRRLNLESRFEVIVVSCDFGRPKPDPGIFLEAATRFGLPPESLLHLGDSPEMDVAGARSAGLRALLLARRRRVRRPGVIHSLRELG